MRSVLIVVRLVIIFGCCCPYLYAQSLMHIQAAVGARANALGGAFSSIADDGSGFLYNPAGVSLQHSFLLSGSANSLHGKIGTSLGTQYWSGVTVPVDGLVIAGNWIRSITNEQRTEQPLPSNDITENERYLNGTRQRQFTAPQEDMFCLSIARNNTLIVDWGWNQYQMPIDIPVGVQMRYHTVRIGSAVASGLSIDAGALVRINLKDMFFSDEYPLLAVSFAMRNIGASLLKWDNGRKDATPYTYTVGTSIQQPLTDLMSDALLSYDYTSQFGGISKIGFEWKYRKMYALRAGVNGRSGTLGGGLDFGFLIADYGYIFPSSQLIGDIHSLTVSFRLERVLQ